MECKSCKGKKFILTFSQQILVDENLNEIDGIEEYIGLNVGVDFLSCAECGEEIPDDMIAHWVLEGLITEHTKVLGS
jgi:hypothetical protein